MLKENTHLLQFQSEKCSNMVVTAPIVCLETPEKHHMHILTRVKTKHDFHRSGSLKYISMNIHISRKLLIVLFKT